MIGYDRLVAQARNVYLDVLGAVQQDGGQLVLLGPFEPGFWRMFRQSPEYIDGGSDPMDRWSERVLRELALNWDGLAMFPFGTAEHLPFHTWALQSGRAWQSPVGMLVHDTQGLLVSFRGAILIPNSTVTIPAPRSSPCTTCDAPCRTACPVNAMVTGSYDTSVCLDYLSQDPRCMQHGCEVRLACPISQRYAREPEQSAFHMKAFRT